MVGYAGVNVAVPLQLWSAIHRPFPPQPRAAKTMTGMRLLPGKRLHVRVRDV